MKLKKISLLLALLMIFSTVSIFAAQLSGNAKIDWLVQKGYVYGDERGLGLDRNISRAEIAAMLSRTKEGGEAMAAALKTQKPSFADVPANQWYTGYINFAVNEGFITGYPDGTFKPSANITNAELISMIARIKNKSIVAGAGANWYMPFVEQATRDGLLDGVYIANYNAQATREIAFTAFYNVMNATQPVGGMGYKGVITADERLGAGSGRFIITVTDISIGSGLRINKGSELTVSANLVGNSSDTDSYIGKQVSFDVDAVGNVTKVTVLSGASMVYGPARLGDNSILINGKTYNIASDITSYQYDYLAKMYHNETAQNYASFVSTNGTTDSNYNGRGVVVEFARASIVNGKVIYLETYDFSDIAPVESVRKGKINYYDDDNRAKITSVTPDAVYEIKNGSIRSTKVDNIKADAVIYLFGRNRVFMTQADVKDGKYNGVKSESGFTYLSIDNSKYQVRETRSKMPVYSTNGKDYNAVDRRDIKDQLRNLEGTKVKYILDLSGAVQLIRGDKAVSTSFAVINARKSDRFDVITSDDKDVTVDIGRRTELFIGRDWKNVSYQDFSFGDLIYIDSEYNNEARRVVRIATEKEQKNDAKELVSSNGSNSRYFDAFDTRRSEFSVKKSSSSTSTTTFEYDKSTAFFIREEGKSQSYYYRASTPEKLNDMLKEGSEVYVVTEGDLYKIDVNSTGRNSDKAAIVVVTKLVGTSSSQYGSGRYTVTADFFDDEDSIRMIESRDYRKGEYGKKYYIAKNAKIEDRRYRTGDEIYVKFNNKDEVVEIANRSSEGSSTGRVYRTIEGYVVSASSYDGIVVVKSGSRTYVLTDKFASQYQEGDTYRFEVDRDDNVISARRV